LWTFKGDHGHGGPANVTCADTEDISFKWHLRNFQPRFLALREALVKKVNFSNKNTFLFGGYRSGLFVGSGFRVILFKGRREIFWHGFRGFHGYIS
jgi:hypothetical protein